MGVGTSKKLATSFAILLTLCFSLMAGVVAHAQVTGATLSGTITDPSGGVVTGAQVSVKNNATSETREVSSDSAGLYSVPNLAPGIYEVRVALKGFATAVQSGLSLAVGQQQQINIALKVGDTSTTVQVTEAAPQIDLTSSALTGQVESETVRELPLNGRDWTSLAQLQPGVKPIETQMSYATSARGNRGFGSELTISGQRSTFNNYRIDGIGVTDYANAAPGNVIGVVLGVDAVEEFSVLTGGFPAEYGRATGGVINAISRSGTNTFHGGVYEFLRNSSFDANDYFTRSSGAPIPHFERNQFGASAGGRIIRDKLFIFGDYEGLRQTKGVPTTTTTFSNNARLGILAGGAVPANNLGAGTPCVQPATATLQAGSAGTYPSALSTVCVSNYAAALLPLFPTSTQLKSNADSALFVFGGVQKVPENFGTARLDYNLGNNDKLFGTFLKDEAVYTQPDAFNNVLSQSNTARTTIAIEETHTFGASFVNAARVGFNRDNVRNQFTPTAVNPLASSTALGSIAGQTAPRLSVHGGISDFFGGTNAGSHYLHTWNSYQYYDDAFWIHGAHTIKFGGGVERMLYNEHTFQEPGGRWQFASYQQFLEGVPKSYEASLVNLVDNPREFRQTLFSAYVQDDWKMKPNLTFNIGLRYEPSTVLKDGQGRITNLATIGASSPTCGANFTAPIPAQVGSSCGSVGPYYKNATLRNFEPRLGFVWDPFKDGKSSVRGSFGIYDVDPIPGYFLLQQNQAGPFLIFKSIKGGKLKAQPDAFEAGNGTTLLNNPAVSNLALSTVEGAPHRSYVMQWNLSLQRQITSDTSLTVGYVGSHGVHLMMRGDDGNMTLPTAVPGVGYEFGGPQVNPAAGIIRYIFWNTDSHYNGLNVSLDKKFSHGFQFQVAYTFSKSLDDDSQTIAGDTFANGINSPWWMLPKLSYGPSDFNVAHTLSINGLYTIPTPKSFGGFAQQALGGWELGSIVTFNSGTPTTPINNGDPLGLNNSGADQFGPLNRIPGCNPIVSNYAGSFAGSPQYINPSCFTEPSVPTASLASLPYPCVQLDPSLVGTAGYVPNAPAGRTYCLNVVNGNYGRNTIAGPHFFTLDFSVLKNFPVKRISETFNVQFRAEMFNLTNHDNFVPPQPCSGDCNSGIIGTDKNGNDGFYQGVGNISGLAGLPREIQFALKVGW